jgi:formate dehydrogenase subunit delta
MEAERLLAMANQIAAFFRAYPHDQAVGGVADHIRQFWDPRSRRRLVAEAAGAADRLDPLVREAISRLPEAGQAGAAAAGN